MAFQGTVTWNSPSNIALIKYWGKKGLQLPSNASLSMTLSKASTTTKVSYSADDKNNIDFFFEGKRNEEFAKRIRNFIHGISHRHAFLSEISMVIESSNTFPHSSGIASSASAMSALSLCLCSIRDQLEGKKDDPDEFFREASFLSRLGSGSACRSVYGEFVLWGENHLFKGSSDHYAIPVNEGTHEYYKGMKDAILIISSEQKKVSSTAGHGLMEGHPYAVSRFRQAEDHLRQMQNALTKQDMESFTAVAEREALSLHALMMSSTESYMLLQPGTVSVMSKIRDFREQTGIPVCFTLDAGPNVHLLYHRMHEDRVFDFINTELIQHCENRMWIDDECGPGPTMVKDEKDQ